MQRKVWLPSVSRNTSCSVKEIFCAVCWKYFVQQCNMQRKVWLPSVSRTDGHQTPPCCCCSSSCCNTPNFPARLMLLCCFNAKLMLRENVKQDRMHGWLADNCKWSQKFMFLLPKLEYEITMWKNPSILITFDITVVFILVLDTFCEGG